MVAEAALAAEATVGPGPCWCMSSRRQGEALALVAREERATAAAATTAAVEVKGARAVLEATGTEAAAAVVVAWVGWR